MTDAVVDAHAHLDHRFGGGWVDRPASELLEILDASSVELLVDLSGGWGVDVLQRHLDHFKAAAPDRFALLGGVDWDGWKGIGASFPEAAARSVADQLTRGASGLKVWKSLGLEVVDERGALVPIDDHRLDPVWSTCATAGVPVVIHVGDPPDFFRPAGPANPRSAELVRHPEWHWWKRAPVGQAELLDQFDRLLARWPDVRFVGAHLLDLVHDPRHLDALLTAHPNLSIDLGARFVELAASGRAAWRVVRAHHRRVLFGLDHPVSVEGYERAVATTRAILAAGGEAPWMPGVLDAVLRRNALALFRP